MWRIAAGKQQPLRQVWATSSSTHHRRTLAAAATSRQKRSLQENSLKGSDNKPPSATSGPPPDATSNGGGIAMVLGSAAMAFTVGAAYMYSTGALDMKTLGIPLSDPPNPATTTVAVKEEIKPTVEEKSSPPEEAPVADTPAVESKSNGPNRVTQIDMPAEMMNKVASTVGAAEIGHPVNGNRVAMDIVPPKPDKKDKSKKKKKKDAKKDKIQGTSLTNEAIQQLQSSATTAAAKSMIQSHQSLWSALDASFFDDLEDLSEAELKGRIVKLVAELKQRTQWEAVRLKEFMAMKEKEVAQQYTELMQKQRIEFEGLLMARLKEQEIAFTQNMKATLAEKDANIKSIVDAALAAQQEEHNLDKEAFTKKLNDEIRAEVDQYYGGLMEDYKSQTETNLQEKVKTLALLSEKLRHLEAALEASQRNQQGSTIAHRLSAAALALSDVLETHDPAAKEVQALKAAAGQDGVIATAVRALPSSVESKGVPTLPELQSKFEDNYKSCRQAALVPEGRPGLDGQLAGMLFSAIKYPPQADDPAPADDPDNAEFILARARQHVKLGELGAAIDELEKLKGQVAFVINDWKQAALDRIAVDKAVKVIKLECALLHESAAE